MWLSCLWDLKNRGLKDIFVACVDGLSGLAEAIGVAFAQTLVQLCMVHLVRAALKSVSDKDSKEVVKDLKAIYQAATAEQAEHALDRKGLKWQREVPDDRQAMAVALDRHRDDVRLPIRDSQSDLHDQCD